MMIVPTFVGPSDIEGVGVFAAEPIAAGSAIWVLDESFDLLLDADQMSALQPVQRQFVDRYGYPHMIRQGVTVLEFDNGRFMNHSDRPNTDFTRANCAWAIRDIAAGEEITCDYAQFDPGFTMLPGRLFARLESPEATLGPEPGV